MKWLLLLLALLTCGCSSQPSIVGEWTREDSPEVRLTFRADGVIKRDVGWTIHDDGTWQQVDDKHVSFTFKSKDVNEVVVHGDAMLLNGVRWRRVKR